MIPRAGALAFGASLALAGPTFAIGYDIFAGTPSLGTNVVVTIPSTVCGVAWEIAGGAGGVSPAAFHGNPGYGGGVQATTAVPRGGQLMLQVGEQGKTGSTMPATGGRSGAEPSGGTSASSTRSGGLGPGGGGGGATIVRSGPTLADAPLLIAGGGGGAGSYEGGGNAGPTGGAGGGFVDGPGTYDGGSGATQTAPGAGGQAHPSSAGNAGFPGVGARGGDAREGSGAGGGGLFGGGSGAQESGGGGAGAGGGGGSNLAPAGAQYDSIAPSVDDGYIQGTYVACTTFAPAAPAAPTAAAGDGFAKVAWSVPADNGSPITGYVVTPYVNGVAQPARTFNSTATSQRIDGLTNNTAYTFVVQAVNAIGTGDASASSGAVTPKATPAPTPPEDPTGPRTPTTPASQTPAGATAAPTTVAAPTLSTDKGPISLAVPGQRITLRGTGFKPGSVVKLTLADPASELASVVVGADGGFLVPVTLPADLASGKRTVLATGADAAGAPKQLVLPVTVLAAKARTSGNESTAQRLVLPVPAGGSATLLNAKNKAVDAVRIAGQGTYRLDKRRNRVTFEPVPGFTGKARPVTYRITEAGGSSVTATYAATVRATKACKAKRTLDLHWVVPKATTLSKVRITVDGKTVRRTSGAARSATIHLRAGSAAAARVRIIARTSTGATLEGRRLRVQCGGERPIDYRATPSLVLRPKN